MKIKYLSIFAALVALSFSSCSESFLDHAPDERTEIDTEDKIIKLLNSAYPGANYSWIAELSSDNLIDNQAPHLPTKPWEKQVETHYNWSSYDRFDDQLFRFEPASMATYGDYDSPGMLWSDYYSSIAICNSALDAAEKVIAENHGEVSEKLKAAMAEAHLVRAYSHFGLVNMFSQAYKDEEASKKDIGVPYVTVLEDVVQKEYNRLNVSEVYRLIQEDLEKGLKDISEINYKVPKWHFNVNAAHAFAARFYLYKREWAKVIEHANAVLGTDNNTLMNMMMDYSIFTECSTGDDYSNAWQDPQLNNNLMLLVTNSLLERRCFGYRYSCAGPSARDIFMISSGHDFWKSYYAPLHWSAVCVSEAVPTIMATSTARFSSSLSIATKLHVSATPTSSCVHLPPMSCCWSVPRLISCWDSTMPAARISALIGTTVSTNSQRLTTSSISRVAIS